MKLLKAMAIAFSIYSKIPVPQFEWKEEDMEYMMCVFSVDRWGDRTAFFSDGRCYVRNLR